MSEARNETTSPPRRLPLPLELINLDAHPDRMLLRLCACLGRMRSAVVELEDVIESTPALTIDGRRMKEMTL